MSKIEASEGDKDGADDAFKVWIATNSTIPGHMGLKGATIKLGPRVCKTVSIRLFGDDATGEVKKRELKFAHYSRRQGTEFDFASPDEKWTAENAEIEKLLAFLNQDADLAGRYRVIDATSPLAGLVDVVDGRSVEVKALIDAITSSDDSDHLAMALAQSTEGISSAEAAVIIHRRNLLDRAEQAAEVPGATETEMHGMIGDASWMFGGQYVGVLGRRQVIQLDEYDIPLVCADGSLHIVELKGPDIPSLIQRHRNHWIVGPEVHEAVMQATNYIRSADELGVSTAQTLRQELGIDVDLRRVFATVVIGHRKHLSTREMPEEQFDIALRTYNAALNRVRVITYDQLFDAARRSLDFSAA